MGGAGSLPQSSGHPGAPERDFQRKLDGESLMVFRLLMVFLPLRALAYDHSLEG